VAFGAVIAALCCDHFRETLIRPSFLCSKCANAMFRVAGQPFRGSPGICQRRFDLNATSLVDQLPRIAVTWRCDIQRSGPQFARWRAVWSAWPLFRGNCNRRRSIRRPMRKHQGLGTAQRMHWSVSTSALSAGRGTFAQL